MKRAFLFCYSFCLAVCALQNLHAEEEKRATPNMKKLLEQFNNASFQIRETASDRLAKWAIKHPKIAKTRLIIEMEKATEPEVTARLSEVLEKILVARARSIFGFRWQPGPSIKNNGEIYGSMFVQRLIPNFPAVTSGLKATDLIFKIGEIKILQRMNKEEIMQICGWQPLDREIKLTIKRSGVKEPLEIKIKPRAEEPFPTDTKPTQTIFLHWLER